MNILNDEQLKAVFRELKEIFSDDSTMKKTIENLEYTFDQKMAFYERREKIDLEEGQRINEERK